MDKPLAIYGYKKWLAIIYLIVGIDLLLTNHFIIGPSLIILSIFFIEFNLKHFEHTLKHLFKVYLSKKIRKSIGIHNSVHYLAILISLAPLFYLIFVPNILQVLSTLDLVIIFRLSLFILISINLLYYTFINLTLYINIHDPFRNKRTKGYHKVLKSNNMD